MIKVNAVVNPKHEDYFFPGRVWKVLNDERYLVICVGKFIQIYNEEDLEVIDYKGRWLDYGPQSNRKVRWLPMTSLRKLKQRARWYNKDIWKKDRPIGALPKNTCDYKRRG